ncbi:hypothetical protein [Patiriisocius sp. Uisw_017]|uniref:hypothetical protein n=1 Tax=Patiriisocius sp. Uisw_017 TaxID=3230968 RepID=UPI0039E8DEA3
MNKILFILFLGIFTTGKSQENWISQENGKLDYSIPDNWNVSEFKKVNNNKIYGATFFDVGKTSVFSVLEMPNDTGIPNAEELTNEDAKNLTLNFFSPSSTFITVENQKISEINVKYVKAKATTSQGLKLTANTYYVFYDGSFIKIDGIYTSEYESEFLPIIKKIINSIKIN